MTEDSHPTRSPAGEPAPPDLGELRERVRRGGRQEYHEANAAKGKLFARERIARLVDTALSSPDLRPRCLPTRLDG